jgi:CubicO group peptidase (beta-lactamase class C family)
MQMSRFWRAGLAVVRSAPGIAGSAGVGRDVAVAAGGQGWSARSRALAAAGLARLPGSAFECCNRNYAVLGLVVEVAAGNCSVSI